MRYFAKRCGVTMLTRASVHCADRIVATTSSSALWWWSAQVASGYSRFSRAMIFRARALRSAAATFVFIGVNRNLLDLYDVLQCASFGYHGGRPIVWQQGQQAAGEEQQFSRVRDGIQSRSRTTRERRTERCAPVLAGGRDFDLVPRGVIRVRSTLEPHGAEPRPVGTQSEDREHRDLAWCGRLTHEHAIERLRWVRGVRRAPHAELRELEIQRALRRRQLRRELRLDDGPPQCVFTDPIDLSVARPVQKRMMQQQHV